MRWLICILAIFLGLPAYAASDAPPPKSTSITFDNSCFAFRIKALQENQLALGIQTGGGDCTEGLLLAGTIGNVKNFGRAISFAYGDTLQAVVFFIQWPLVTGGKWSVYATSNGHRVSGTGAGTYTVVGGAVSAKPALAP